LRADVPAKEEIPTSSFKARAASRPPRRAREFSDEKVVNQSRQLRGANGSGECPPDDRLRDEAIQSFFAAPGLLRFARNDGVKA
jgi:hypothetical protein